MNPRKAFHSSKRARRYQLLHIALSMMLVFCVAVSIAVPARAGFGDEVWINVDLNAPGKVIENKFSELLVHNDFNSVTASREPYNYFSYYYPFTEKVEIIDGTGGNEKQDLFIDPNDRTTLTDYKFDNLMISCRNIVRQGLKPYIVTGNVPLKFCANPYISPAFNVNVRPPDNYDQYYTYIKAVAEAMVAEFGLAEVKTWSWGVFTEYENKDWFCAADGTAASTKAAYFKLYDYTVAALQDVVGADYLDVGAHGMVVVKGFWDVGDFIDHCAFGTNYKTGGKGTQINFLTTSYYDNKPGDYTPKSLVQCINQLRDRAVAGGLTNLRYGADEGRILEGADGKPITAREVGMSYQGAADARLFKTMIENDISWFAARAYNTGTIWGGIDTVSAHIANLGYKMTGDTYVQPVLTSPPGNPTDEVAAISGFNQQTRTAHIMLYNYNKNPDAISKEPTTVTVNNANLIDGSEVTVTQWIVDDTHGNFWPAWWKDANDRGIDYSTEEWSRYSTTVTAVLNTTEDKAFWNTNYAKYAALAELKSTTFNAKIENGSITLSTELDHHGVVFYEITEKQPDPLEQITVTDDLDNWTVANYHTPGLYFDTGSSGVLLDTSRAARMGSQATQTQYVTYKLDNIRNATVTGLFASASDPVVLDYKLYTSPDGVAWTGQSGYTYRDTLINGNSWTKRVYTLNHIPDGTNYFKVEFPAVGTYTWNPQLSQVVLSSPIYKPGDINGDNAVDLKDVTTLGRYVAGWEVLTDGSTMDVNDDNAIDLMDVTILSRFLAGWNVVIH